MNTHTRPNGTKIVIIVIRVAVVVVVIQNDRDDHHTCHAASHDQTTISSPHQLILRLHNRLLAK